MSELAAFIDRYVSVWNETDLDARKRTIVALWAPDGTTCNRQLEACGYEAIEARVASANQKWVRDQGFTFRPRQSFALHHHVVKLVWEMVPASGGEVAAAGLIVLILSPEGRIRADYQFSDPSPPASRELTAFVDRYVAFWNEPDANRRRQELAELWAEDATFLSATSEQHGWVGIEAEALETYAACGAKGFVICSTNAAEGHHHVIRMGWEIHLRAGGEVAGEGLALLVLDGDGRIRADYQFTPFRAEGPGPRTGRFP